MGCSSVLAVEAEALGDSFSASNKRALSSAFLPPTLRSRDLSSRLSSETVMDSTSMMGNGSDWFLVELIANSPETMVEGCKESGGWVGQKWKKSEVQKTVSEY